MNTRHPDAGFTLIELLVAMTVGAILLAVAMPSFKSFAQNSRLTSAANDLLGSLQNARTEAIKRQANVVVCGTNNPDATTPVCTYGTGTGWIVFQDSNGNFQSDGVATEPVIERHPVLDSTVTVHSDGKAIVSYNATGFANPTGAQTPSRNIVLCDVRGVRTVGTFSTARAVVISPTGRSKVANTPVEVNAAVTATGTTCP